MSPKAPLKNKIKSRINGNVGNFGGVKRNIKSSLDRYAIQGSAVVKKKRSRSSGMDGQNLYMAFDMCVNGDIISPDTHDAPSKNEPIKTRVVGNISCITKNLFKGY